MPATNRLDAESHAPSSRAGTSDLFENAYSQSLKLPARGARKPSEDEQDGSFGSEPDNE